MELRDWFTADHRDLRTMFERTILQPTSRALLTARPGETGNSIAWLMWHLARVEDVVINTVVRARPQVLLAEGWAKLERLTGEERRALAYKYVTVPRVGRIDPDRIPEPPFPDRERPAC